MWVLPRLAPRLAPRPGRRAAPAAALAAAALAVRLLRTAPAAQLQPLLLLRARAGGAQPPTRVPALRCVSTVDEAGVGEVPFDAVAAVDAVAEAAATRVGQLADKVGSLRKQVRDPAEADEWLNRGNSLLGLPRNQWRQGLTQVEVPDYGQLDESGMPTLVTVQLEPKKDFQKNAELCFKKSRKIRRAVEKLAPMIEACETDLARWEAHAADAAKLRQAHRSVGALSREDEEVIRQLHDELVGLGLVQLPAPPEPERDPAEEAAQRFKRKYGKDIDCYLSPGGHEVVCGRSSTMNEYVSLRLAKGDMVWFHTDKGIPGSHVLIRAPWDEVPQDDFEFAAKIAAYHSKGKDKGNVPVMYCKGHQVRKPKGSPKGTVTVNGDRYSMVVEPGLPERGG